MNTTPIRVLAVCHRAMIRDRVAFAIQEQNDMCVAHGRNENEFRR
jgi:hypothetical protein